MDISHVLSLVNPEASGDSKISKEKGLTEGDTLLFSLLLSDILSVKPEAKEQIAEESLFASSSMFSLQHIFPAGKDANSGLNGEQNQKDIVLSQIALSVVQGGMEEKSLAEALSNLSKQISTVQAQAQVPAQMPAQMLVQAPAQTPAQMPAQVVVPDAQPDNNQTSHNKTLFDTVLPLKDIGSEGIRNSISREISSLSPAELDKYINTLELLKGLSGQIKLTDSQKPALSEMVNKISYLIAQQQQSLGKDNNVKVTEIMPGDKILANIAVKAGDGNIGQAQSQNNKSTFDVSPVDAQVLENKNQEDPKLDYKKVAEVTDILVPKNTGMKASAEEIVNKVVEPQINIASQQTMTKIEGSPSADKVIVPEMPTLVSGKLWDQVMEHLRKQEYSQVKELSIQLHPAELGKVNVSVRLENGQVHLVINATEGSTANFLQNNLAELRSGLSQSGVDCGTLEMGSNDSGFNSNREFNSEEEDSLPRLTEEEKTYYPGFVSAMSVNSSGSRINVKA